MTGQEMFESLKPEQQAILTMAMDCVRHLLEMSYLTNRQPVPQPETGAVKENKN